MAALPRAAHYNSHGASGRPSPRRRGSAPPAAGGPNYPSRGAPRAMEERVAERLRGALGPLGFEVHAFKVLTSRRRAVVVTSPSLASCREMPPSRGAGCSARSGGSLGRGDVRAVAPGEGQPAAAALLPADSRRQCRHGAGMGMGARVVTPRSAAARGLPAGPVLPGEGTRVLPNRRG